MGERRAEDRRVAERRDGERRDVAEPSDNSPQPDRRTQRRRLADRRDGDRRTDERRTASPPGTVSVGALLGERRGVVHHLPLGSSLVQAAELMSAENIGIVLVVAESGGLIGLLSERNIARAFAAHGAAAVEMTLDAFVTRGIWACAPTDTVQTAIKLMRDHHLRHLPVVDDGGAIGVISATDLIAAFAD